LGFKALSRKQNNEQDIKRMVDLLRQGSTLTDLACPACASPLFRLKNGSLWCAKDQKKVIIVKEGEASKLTSSMAMDNLEKTLLEKVNEVQSKMQNEQNPEELQKLGTTLSGLLENLEKIKKIKKT
jgi:uncharacterized Zn finger protein (UPF0148 family)